MDPTTLLPGSDAKIELLSQRLLENEPFEIPLHHEDDAKAHPVPPPIWVDREDLPPVPMSPQQEIAAAIIKEALRCVSEYQSLKQLYQTKETNARQERDFARYKTRAAICLAWIFDESDTACYRTLSFNECCAAYEADADAIRQSIRERLGMDDE
ncbi:MAG: hypothetical protein E6Q97_12095 [Desulfurellales bacterium]|nr:MAG: hypothetical protein E6Q97_12095 [Desulfurellales bacterium]